MDRISDGSILSIIQPVTNYKIMLNKNGLKTLLVNKAYIS